MSANFSGVWSGCLKRSKLTGPLPRAIFISIVQSGSQLKQEMVVTKLDGSPERAVFECSSSGEPDRSLLNGSPVRGSARWEGEELVIESRMRVGSRDVYFCDCWSLSADGQTLSMEHRNGDLAGQVMVLDRAG